MSPAYTGNTALTAAGSFVQSGNGTSAATSIVLSENPFGKHDDGLLDHSFSLVTDRPELGLVFTFLRLDMKSSAFEAVSVHSANTDLESFARDCAKHVFANSPGQEDRPLNENDIAKVVRDMVAIRDGQGGRSTKSEKEDPDQGIESLNDHHRPSTAVNIDDPETSHATAPSRILNPFGRGGELDGLQPHMIACGIIPSRPDLGKVFIFSHLDNPSMVTTESVDATPKEIEAFVEACAKHVYKNGPDQEARKISREKIAEVYGGLKRMLVEETRNPQGDL